MSSFFSSIQQYAGPFVTVAAGAAIARLVGDSFGLSDAPNNQYANRFNMEGGDSTASGKYKPTPIDVVVVRVMLEKAVKLPPELLDIIVDYAEYWPHSEATLVHVARNARDALRVVGTTNQENKLIVRCPPIGFVDYKKIGEAFKTAALPSKSVEGSDVIEPLRSLTLMEPSSTPTEPTHEAPREYFTGSISQAPALVHPVRKIVFKLRSKDQGWGGTIADRGTYQGSWSWFEAGLEKFDKDGKCDGSCKMSAPSQNPEPAQEAESDTPNFCTCGLQSIYPPVVTAPNGSRAYHHGVHARADLKIQNNKTAVKDYADHEVVWSWTDDIEPESPEGDHLFEIGRGRETGTGNFVRSLKLGDVVTVWAKARFGGWANYIESVKVEIYWAI